MLRKMTIGKKLYCGFGVALALTLALGAVGLNSLDNVATTTDKLLKAARKRHLSVTISKEMNSILAAERGILVRAFMKDRVTMEQYNRDFETSSGVAKKAMDEFLALADPAEARLMTEEVGSSLEAIRQGHAEFWSQASSGQTDAAAEAYKTRTNPAIKQAVKIADGLETQQSAALAAITQEEQAVTSRARWTTWTMIALCPLVFAVLIYIVRGINTSLRVVISDLSEGAGQVASAAGQISSSSQSLAQGSSEQAASLEETSASSEEINSMARKNSENSQLAAGLVTQSQQKFTETNRSLESMVVAMEDIKSSSDKVARIIKVIDEIAFQTNILALNAAVEAARAGEAGLVLAVVAYEVRNLSQRCAQAARDTALLIEESIVKSGDGKTKVDQVAVAIRSVTEESANVKTLVDEVSLGSLEQTRGIEQVAKALTQMEQVTQQTAASAEQSAAASQELTAQASALMDVVSHLTAMVVGSAPAERTPVGRPLRPQPQSASSLNSLQRAVTGKRRLATPQLALPVRRAAPDSFPMEDEFREMS